MSESAFEQLVIEELKNLKEGHKQMLSGMSELKGEIAAVASTSERTLLHPAGRNYYGALWRTDDGSDTPLWAGPVVIKKAAPQA